MKTFKNILAIALFASFLVACTPTQLNDDNPNATEHVATGGDDSAEVDTTKD